MLARYASPLRRQDGSWILGQSHDKLPFYVQFFGRKQPLRQIGETVHVWSNRRREAQEPMWMLSICAIRVSHRALEWYTELSIGSLIFLR